MDEEWWHETARVTAGFDRIADFYRRQFADELDRKPFDRELLDRVAKRLVGAGPVLEVGAGPAHIGGYLAARGVSMLASDASPGQMREARILDASRPLLVADLGRLPTREASLAGIVGFYCLIYGPAQHLSDVFAEWRWALMPGGVVVIAVHAGDGTHLEDIVNGRGVDITVVFRDPDELVSRLRGSGFAVEEVTVRRPYHDEMPTNRCYLLATRRGE